MKDRPWIVRLRPVAAPLLRLVCFPYAGGAASVFAAWPSGLPPWVELHAVELPGHGTRLLEPPLRRLDDVIPPVLAALEPLLDRPLALFGHSMGALTAFEVTRAIVCEHGQSPGHLFVSGAGAPHARDADPDRPFYRLPDEKLLRKIREYGGTPEALLNHRELMELMLPVLRADFEVCETRPFRPGPALECPIVAFGGLADKHVPREQLEAWRCHTRASFASRMLRGDHFFLNTARPLLLRMLAEHLVALAGGQSNEIERFVEPGGRCS